MFNLLRSTVLILNPIVVTIILSFLIVVGLAVHAYFDTRKKHNQESLIIELPDMAAKADVDQLRIAWACCSRTINLACELLSLLCTGYKETEERRCICRLITEFVLPPRTINSGELSSRLASQKEFSVREFDTLKELFRKALEDYVVFVETIEREGKVLWGESGLVSSQPYANLLQRNAKCLEELEKLSSLPDLQEVVSSLGSLRRLLPMPA
jgi:hypothetical protein